MRTLYAGCLVLMSLRVQFHLIFYFRLVLTDFVSPYPYRKIFVKEGDFKLGILMSLSSFDIEEQRCDGKLASLDDIHWAQALAFAVKEVNEDKVLPNNLSLGFVMLDDCYSVQRSVAESLSFLPQSSCSPQNSTSNTVPFYDVVGVIGCIMSSQSAQVARLFSMWSIPIVSFTSTSNGLNDRDVYPYFLRTATSNRYQYEAMLHFIKYHNWTFISLIFEDGSFDFREYLSLKNLFESNGVCFAVLKKVSSQPEDSQIQDLVQELWQYQNARVVILIVSRSIAYSMIKSTEELYNGTFIWVGNDAWTEDLEYLKDLGQLLWGSFIVIQNVYSDSDYDIYFRNLTPDTNAENPWFLDFWQMYFNTTHTPNETDLNLDNYNTYAYAGRIIDVVRLYAEAIARTINSSRCSANLSNNPRDCMTSELKNELLKTSFLGKTGQIEFNEKGERLGTFQIRQLLPVPPDKKKIKSYLEMTVAEYDSRNGKLRIERNISWIHHWLPQGKLTPESKCSEACPKNAIIIPTAIKCCWMCEFCRDNEQIIGNQTDCSPCLNFTWPDNDTSRTTCKSITPQIPSQTALTILGIFFIVVNVILIVIFHRYRNESVIKASSKRLSHVMLFATSLGYSTIIVLQFRPGEIVCPVAYWCFCLSFTLLYGPLFIRALCIYRIFESGRRAIKRPKLVGKKDQIFLTIGFGFIQASISTLEMMTNNQWYHLTMKVSTVPEVELSCNITQTGSLSFLAYNLLILVMCTYLAYKSRNLPDNFNESRFISFCVVTTLLLWTSFIPSYLLASREYIKALLLALTLSVNHSVALVFLFIPKVYAVFSMKRRAIHKSVDVSGKKLTIEVSKLQKSLAPHIDSGMKDDLTTALEVAPLPTLDKSPSLEHIDKLPSLEHIDKSPSLEHIDKSPRLKYIDKSPSLEHIAAAHSSAVDVVVSYEEDFSRTSSSGSVQYSAINSEEATSFEHSLAY